MPALTGSRAARLRGFWCAPEAPGRSIDLVAVALFFAVACLWSWLVSRWGDFRLPGGGDAPRVDGTALIGFGPLLGALAAGMLRPDLPQWPVGFRGRAPRWAVPALLVPIGVAALAGVGRFHVEAHLDAATLAASVVVAKIGEEVGWREWLYNAFAGRPLWQAALATWALWLAWHVPIAGALGLDFGFTLALVLLAASFALAALVRATGSSALAAAWHAVLVLAVPAWATVAIVLLLAAVTAMAVRDAGRLSP